MAFHWSALTPRQAPSPPPLTPEEMAYNNAPQILGITGTFFALAALVVLLRCYVRIRMLKVFGLDDYIMIFAMVLCAATFACFKLETNYGLGRHLKVVIMDPVNLMTFSKIQYIHAIIIMVGISAVKISIAFCLLRLSTQRTYSRILYGSIGFIVVMTLACGGTLVFQCLPVQAAWDGSLRPPPFGTGDAKCYSLTIFRNLGLMNSAFNIVTDALFASLPVPLIWQLQLNNRTKISLILILSLGWFACVAAIIKAVKQWNVLTDPDWSAHDEFNVWNYIEFTVGIVAASLPTLKPIFNWFLETARAITTGPRSRGESYKNTGTSSRGYQNKTGEWNKDIAMGSYPSKGSSSPTNSESLNPYHVKVSTQPTGRADKEAWEAVHRKDSDESVYPLRPHPMSPNGIVRTREVSVV